MRIATWHWGGRRHAGFMSADGREVTPPHPKRAERVPCGIDRIGLLLAPVQ